MLLGRTPELTSPWHVLARSFLVVLSALMLALAGVSVLDVHTIESARASDGHAAQSAALAAGERPRVRLSSSVVRAGGSLRITVSGLPRRARGNLRFGGDVRRVHSDDRGLLRRVLRVPSGASGRLRGVLRVGGVRVRFSVLVRSRGSVPDDGKPVSGTPGTTPPAPGTPPFPGTPAPGTPPSPPLGGGAVVVAAGDVACPSTSQGTTSCGQKQTGDVIRQINPDVVVGLGDYQYDYGTLDSFAKYYEPFWGSFKAKTRAINGGSHDFYGGGDYYTYFGSSAGPAPYASYSYDVGAWHLIALNNYCSNNVNGSSGGCGVGSQWYNWLKADLEANPRRCTLVYWHQPYWTSGASHAPYSAVSAYVQLMYDHGVDVLLQAHNHQYERFAPQTPAGVRDDARGIQAFVVGTGGRSFYGFNSTPAPNSLVRNADTFGVLQMSLRSDSYDYEFKPIVGKTFTDTGTRNCS